MQMCISEVAMLEWKLAEEGTKVPWTAETLEYITTLGYIRKRNFYRALDKLQQLVIQRLFEMSKANIVGLGKYCDVDCVGYVKHPIRIQVADTYLEST